MKNKKNILIIIIIILIDQLVKYLLINKYYTIVPDFLYLTYTQNEGAAFGIGTKHMITILNAIIIIALIYIVAKKRKNIKNIIPFTFVLGGGISNLIDRLFRGYVTDYIDINVMNFPNFNIADICVTIGIIMIVITMIKERK